MDKPILQISKRVTDIPEALSVYVNNLVYKLKNTGRKIVTLSLGEAFFDIPFWGFDEIDVKKGYHYSESRGIPGLRKKIADQYDGLYGVSINPEKEILISSGSKPLIFMILQAILNPEDEVLIHEPAWLSYPEQIKLVDGIPRYIPYDVEVKDFVNYVSEKTKAIIINNPNNPAGKVYSKTELKLLYEEMRSRGIYIIIDEAYSTFVEESNFASMTSIVPDKDGIIVVNSLSKNMGISGWRIGYVVSTEEIIYNILKLNQHLVTCASTLLLMYVERYYEKIYDITMVQAKEVTDKRNALSKYAESIGLSTLGGCATFYMFVGIDQYPKSSLDFALYLLFKYNIAVVPGAAYGESTERFVRVSVGTEKDEIIRAVLQKIKEVIISGEYDESVVQNGLMAINEKKFEY